MARVAPAAEFHPLTGLRDTRNHGTPVPANALTPVSHVAASPDGLFGIDSSSQNVRAAGANLADQQTSNEPDCRAEWPEK